ncbi:Mu transposase domain-containing protein [Actinacidiphila glaucinigra]|uniref:Mu transposase domain-containing protein n=1 Tax=Actinacidiphila glaucinigra TaxID=235986 RepID=UPI00366E086C
MTEVNARIHRETRQAPAELLAEERLRLHPVPEQPFTTAFGEIRRVGKDSTISVESIRYSVPDQLVDARVRSGLGYVGARAMDVSRGPIAHRQNLGVKG